MVQDHNLRQENRALKKEVIKARGLVSELEQESGFSEMLIKSLPGIFYLVDGSFRFHRWNGTLERLTGYSPGELMGKNGLELFEGDGLRKIRHGLETALTKGEATEEAELIDRSGVRIPYLFTGTSARLKGKRYVLGTGIDLRAHMATGKALLPPWLATKEDPLGSMVGESPAMQEVQRLVSSAAASSANVIVYGESGTGKELFARAVHERSRRSDGAFVPVNCAAIPENLLESEFFGYRKGAFTGANLDKPGYLDLANGGTLFLDEVDELTEILQAKLLRAIELGEYSPVGSTEIKRSDFRIISATNNVHLIESPLRGSLRTDFFYRIHIIPVHLPPLRQRREDIPLLAEHFLGLYSEQEEEIPPLPCEMLGVLMEHDWPGNVRELQNVVQRYLVGAELELPLATPRTPEDPRQYEGEMGFEMGQSAALRHRLRRAEKSAIAEALDRYGDNRSQAASMLGVSRMTLYRKMKRLGMI